MDVKEALITVGLLVGGILALCLICIYAQFNPQEFISRLLALPPTLLLACLALLLTEYFLQCERFRVITGSKMRILPFSALYNVGHLVAFISPARSIGEAARVLVFSRALKLSKTHALSAVVSERALDIFVLAVASIGIVALVSSTVVPIALLLASLVLLAVLSNRFIQRTILSVIPLKPLREFAGTYFTHSAAMFACKKKVSYLVLLSVALWIADFLRYWLILQAFGVIVPFEISASITSLSYFSTVLSIFPGGLAFFEGFGVASYSLLGYDAGQVMSAILAERLLSYWLWVFTGTAILIVWRRRFFP